MSELNTTDVSSKEYDNLEDSKRSDICPVNQDTCCTTENKGECLLSGYGEQLGNELKELQSQGVLSEEQLLLYPANIKLCDETDGLKMYCYTKCDHESDDMIKRCRGLVFNNGQLVSRAFQYTPDYSADDIDILHDLLDDIIDQCKFYVAYEGALVRLFYQNSKWYLSTHRKLNAYSSKWSSRVSFGDMFEKAVEWLYTNNKEFHDEYNVDDQKYVLSMYTELLFPKICSKLDTQKQYVFLVCNDDENRIVCKPPNYPRMFHVGTFDQNGYMFDNSDLKIPTAEQVQCYTVEDLIQYCQNSDHFQTQGVVVFLPNGTQIKVHNSMYHRLFHVRGNEPSVPFRYLQVRNNLELVNELKTLYPKWVSRMNDYETYLQEIAKQIYEMYTARFIRRQFVQTDQEEFKVMSALHTWYKDSIASWSTGGNRGPKPRVSIELTLKQFETQSPTALNRMIKRYYNNYVSPSRQDDNDYHELSYASLVA